MRIVFLCLLLPACSNSPSSSKATIDFAMKPTVTHGTWVAKYAGQTVTDADLSQRFAEMNAYGRARFQAVEQRRDYLEGMVRYELMAQEAVKQGLANDPEVVDAAKRTMVQLLLKRELDDATSTITPAQLKAYYDAHLHDFVKPAMIRLSHIFFTKDHRAKADEVLKQVLALAPLDYAAFGKLAKEHSEEPKTQPLEGDMRFMSEQELKDQYGEALVTAAANLKQAGEVVPTLVETEKGFHIVKLQGRQIALNLNLEAATPSIQSNLANESKQARFKALIDRVEKAANVEINEAALQGIKVDGKAAAVPVKSPPAGYLPMPAGGSAR